MKAHEEEEKHNVWEVYRREWATASPEKKLELNERMSRWQELMKSGLSASQAYTRVMGGESKETPQPITAEKKTITKVEGALRGNKKAKIIKKLLIGLGSVFGLFILIGIIAVATSDESPPATTPSTPPVETEQAPTPTSTSKPPFTTREQIYATIIVNQSNTLSEAFTKLGELLQNLQFGNDEWMINVAVQLVTIRSVYNEAMEIEPPASMTEIHYKYVQGLKHYNTMVDLFTEGFDQLDVDLINQASSEMTIGVRYINEATTLMREFMASRE